MSSNKTKPKETGDSKETFENLLREINRKLDSLPQMQQSIDTLLRKVTKIDSHVKKLETRVSVLESRTDTGDISKEVRMAMNRERSVIVFNLPEGNDDKSSIKSLVENLGILDRVDVGFITRLGKQVAGVRPRPVLVNLDSQYAANLFISSQREQRLQINSQPVYVQRNMDSKERKDRKDYFEYKKSVKQNDKVLSFKDWKGTQRNR